MPKCIVCWCILLLLIVYLGAINGGITAGMFCFASSSFRWRSALVGFIATGIVITKLNQVVHMNTEIKYSPKSIDEFIFANDKLKLKVER